ncbi:hypothetical protein A3B45_00570 [Candidatus Daviesbacteria bacterium RIFCSPLOWO2_01_FULL_39_12]|uniref:Uncharacterized protein n=1 Tax=Candidatus Daviesbacteria bacterium RIFCSPLOWO2_01_FULL_39_12 TaxID=1797785 RepID=A0A1F5KMR2_9BACT|nr:MAG: hypothetical protein A3D79_02285 [Candidatus Daviesbacteria bacterium RIFCSPHIGHO2_02_FULL_39_8]OGE42134.1 MAG: hypothetical protein A3B45_00570 [Candidatus Daviesbacteria bacterium RIFCSPLOWO2_01_FULL_39_12]
MNVLSIAQTILAVLWSGFIFAVGYFTRGWIERHFKRSDVKWGEKRQLAKDILAFVDEGQGTGYEVPLDHVRFKESSRLVSLSLPYSKTASKNLLSFYGTWTIFAMMNPERMKIPPHQYTDHIKMLSEKREVIDDIADDIRVEVTKWLKK